MGAIEPYMCTVSVYRCVVMSHQLTNAAALHPVN